MDKTLLKGLAVLQAISGADPAPRGIDKLAALAGLTRSNAHRTLATLIHAGYVRRDRATGTYGVTMKVLALGLAAMGLRNLQQIAPGFMATLANATGETVHLSELQALEVRYVDTIESRQPVRAYSEIGGRAPAHAVATGKALLAAQPSSWLDTLPEVLERYTPATLTTKAALRTALDEVARTGYAVNRGEWRDGVGGLATVVRDATGQPIAALGISGPLDRLTPSRMLALAPGVMDLAQQLSATLSHLERLAAGQQTIEDR